MTKTKTDCSIFNLNNINYSVKLHKLAYHLGGYFLISEKCHIRYCTPIFICCAIFVMSELIMCLVN